MSRSNDYEKILGDVIENVKVLGGCAGPHEFPPINDKDAWLVCRKCGGRLTASEVYWYKQGVNHGLASRHEKT